MGIQTTASQQLASKLLRHFNMKPLIILGLVAFVGAQYSGETQDLSNSQLDALKDIFGDAAGGGAYSGQQVGRLEGGTNGVEAIIQVVKNEEGYVAPDDYQTTAGLVDKATTNVDNVNTGHVVDIFVSIDRVGVDDVGVPDLELFDFVLESSCESPEDGVACLLGQPPLVQIHLAGVTLVPGVNLLN